MSGRTEWTNKAMPDRVIKRYPREMRQQLISLTTTGEAEWRISGSNYFEVRPVGKGDPVRLSLTGKDPVYAAKWRSFIRQQNFLEMCVSGR